MKKSRFIIGLIYVLLASAILLVLMMVRQKDFSVYLILNNDGYLISNNNISNNLFNDKIDPENSEVNSTRFSVSDIVYKRSGKYYLGEEKLPINDAFPLYINNTSTVMQLTDSASLITNNFEFFKSYSGLYIIDGISFNPDSERAYREEFILQGLSNGLFINTMSINVSGNFFLEKNIPNNSVIRFMEHEIRYYSLVDEQFIYSAIKPLGSTSMITVNGKTYKYYDFLEKLGLFEKGTLIDTEPSEDTNEPEDIKTVLATPTPIAKPIDSEAVDKGNLDIKQPEDTSDDKSIPTIEIITVPERTDIPDAPEVKSDASEDEETVATIKPKPTKRPDRVVPEDSDDLPAKPAKPALAAKPADLPQGVPQQNEDSDYYANIDYSDDMASNEQEEPEEEEEKGIKNWKKPVVTLGSFSTSVYSLFNDINIENEEFLYRSGVSFDIYEDSRLIMKKSYNASSKVAIGPLKPGTNFRVEVVMNYINKLGQKEEEIITKAEIQTRPLSDLEPLRFNWTNGDIFHNRLQLKDLTIINALKEGSSLNEYTLNEAVQYMNRFEVVISGRDDTSLYYSYAMNSKNLSDLRYGKTISYDTPGNIKSNNWYYYEFICYDRFGNVLPVEGVVRGTSHTCKQPPKASIKLIKNEVKNIELSIKVENPDKAEIEENIVNFAIYDMEDNPVETTIARMTSDGKYSSETERSITHSLTTENNTIRFMDLVDHEVYNIRVFCDYNINDNMGIYSNAIIGELKFTTVPISSLGFAFFDVNINNIDDRSASFTVELNSERTDKRLTSLISDIDIAIINADTMTGEGISTYHQLVPEGSTFTIPELLPDNAGLVSLTEDEVGLLKTGENGVFNFHISKLNSKTEYKLMILPKVKMGLLETPIYRDIQTFYTPESFTTLKKTPMIAIDAIYASSEFIKLYGVSVIDPDNAVISYPVTIVVYDDTGRQIASTDLLSGDKTTVVDITRLERDKVYTFRFFANEYNNGNTMSTYRKGFELYYSELFEAKEHLRVTTKEAISGSIELLQVNKYKINKQLNIPARDMRSYTSGVTLYNNIRFSSNSRTRAKYSATVDFGSDYMNSFQIRYSFVSRATDYKIYLEDPDANPNAIPIAFTSVSERTISSDFTRWTEVQLFDNGLSLTGKHTFYIVANTVDGGGGIHCLYNISFQNSVKSSDSSYYANIHSLVNDVNRELYDTSYILKIYKNDSREEIRRHRWVRNSDGSFTLNMYRLEPDNTEKLVDSKLFNGSERYCDTDFYYEVDKGYNEYRFELWVQVFDYEIMLDEVEFTTEEEIIGIRTEEDLRNVRYGLDKKYYVLNDISLSSGVNNITASGTFQGELDFRGHTLIYNSRYSLIPYIGYNGVLKNLVFTYNEIWGTVTENLTDWIVHDNLGTIQNIMVLRNNGNSNQSYKSETSCIVRNNMEGGIIENFVIKLVDAYIGTNYVSGAAVNNRGIIRNGYIYGKPIQRTNQINITESQYSENNYMGGLVSVNRPGGLVENVYSLIDIKTRENLSVSDYAYTIVGLNQGELKNSFSSGDVHYGDVIRTDFGPAYRNSRTTSTARNVYYYSALNYGNTNNARIAKLVLYDKQWYENLFNGPTSSVKYQFDLNPIKLGYYPHVNWPKLMPKQEFVSLPELTDDNNINIINTEIIEQGVDFAKAIITFDNPDNFAITEINVRWLDTEIISQEEDGKFYRVTVRLTQPDTTKYYSSYNITSFKYSLGFRFLEYSVFYDENPPSIPAEFYKPISTVEEWASIKDDYEQNYRLISDLDFQFRAPSIVVMPANVTLDPNNANFKLDAFSGKLDGNGYSLKFIDTGDYGYVIGKLSGSVKNLTVEHLNLKEGSGRYKGFIGRMLEDSIVDNVHIMGVEAISHEHCGAIAGDIYDGTIINSSAHNIMFTTTAGENYTQYIGGLVGKHRASSINTIYGNMIINNCYVDTLDIKVLSAGDCGGAGGLVGSIRASAEIYNVYAVNGTIDTAYKNIGGLIGAVDTFTYHEASRYMLKDFYVDVDINSITERAGGIIGYTAVNNAEGEVNGLVLGDISSTKPTLTEIGRYYGFSSQEANDVYGYELSRVNGAINTDDGRLTYGQICNPATYEPGGPLDWEADFVRNTEELTLGILPKLNDVKGQYLLPYQRDYQVIRNEINIKNIQSINHSTGELFVVQIETEHEPDITIQDSGFRGLLPAALPDAVKIERKDDGTGTYLEYILDLEGYYDSYYLTELSYTIEGNPNIQKQCENLSVGIAPQYLKISSADEWNEKMALSANGLKRYNVQITGDLDFSPYLGAAARGVIVNNLIGSSPEEGQWKSIKNINMVQGESLVEAVFGDISYLNFENINYTKTSANAVNCFGLFTAVTGDIHDVGFSNINISANNSAYVAIAALSYGSNYNITMDNLQIIGTYTTLPTKRAVGGLAGRLSGSGSVVKTTANNIIVEGRGYVGGLVGTQEDGRNLWNNDINNAVVSALRSNGADNYVGGIVGYANVGTLTNIVGNNRVKQAVILGNAYVGGISGQGNNTGNSLLTNLQNDIYKSQVDNVFVVGLANEVGGITGRGMVRRAEVRDAYIFSRYHIGGITGNGASIDTSCLDSTIGTVYNREIGDTGNLKFQNTVTRKRNEYLGLTGNPSQLAVYNKADTALGYLITSSRNTTYSTTDYTGSINSFIGGISGRTICVWNSIVANCEIGSFGAIDVGGIVGRTAAAANESWPYRMTANGTINCKIYGASNIGGIIGSSLRGYITSCYSNSDVTATIANAGGIAGYVNATGLYALSETPNARHIYYGGTVTAPTYAAGVFGRMDQDLFDINDGWLMIGNVAITNPGGKGDFFLNRQTGDSRGITKAMVYKGNTFTVSGTSYTAEEFYLRNPQLLIQDDITLADSAMLSTKSTYIDMLNWNTEAVSYSSRYYNYNGLKNGYMPYLTNAPANNYDSVSALRLMKYQEGYEPDKLDPTKPAVDINNKYIYQYETYKGGIPIPGSGAPMIKRRAAKIMTLELPKAKVYTVDVDKLNIDFPVIDPDALITVYADGKPVAESKIDKRTLTLNYDFKTELELIISKNDEEESYVIWPEDVTRNVMTWNSDYYYVTGSGIWGSREELKGVYVNLYSGQALDASGNVYNIENGQLIRSFTGISFLGDSKPLHSFSYEDYIINTFNDYSIVDTVTRNNMRIYVKSGEVSAISSNLKAVVDSIIIDVYNGEKYCAVLSEGSIVDMTDNAINIPKDFENGDIQYMTNNINCQNPILLVRYYDGAVAGFNYISGELLPIDSPRGTVTKHISPDGFSGRSSNTSMTNFASLYQDVMLLETNINDMGWAEFNGTNIETGNAVPEDGGLTELDMAMLGQNGNTALYNAELNRNNEFITNSITSLSDAIANAITNGASESEVKALAASINKLREMGAPIADITRLEEAFAQLSLQTTQYNAFDDPNSPYFDGFANSGLLTSEPSITPLPGEANNLDDKALENIAFEDNAPEGKAPEGKAPEDKASEDEALEDIASDDIAPEGNTPEDKAPDGRVPEDKASEDKASEDKTPEDKALENISEEALESNTDKTNGDNTNAEQASITAAKEPFNRKEKKVIRYIPIYDTAVEKYELYDVQELLTKQDEELLSINKKLERSGHMIDYRPKYSADTNTPGDDNLYGYILLSMVITGVGLLLSYLIFRKHKEAIV